MTKKTIMVIDDSGQLRELYKFNLEEQGFSTILAKDALEASEILKEEKPDLVLLDLLMPKKNGLEFLEEMKKNPETKEITVVVLTNVFNKEEIDKALSLGAIDYLVKFQQTPDEVIEKINEILR